MFMIINIDEDSISVLDTSDGVIEVHPRDVVEQLSKRVNIAGVSNNKVTSYKDIKKVIRDLIVVEHKYEDAVKSLPEGYEITIYFKTKPTSGELHFVSHTNYNWRKSAINSWSRQENHRSKSYRSGFTDAEVALDIKENLDFYVFESIRITE